MFTIRDMDVSPFLSPCRAFPGVCLSVIIKLSQERPAWLGLSVYLHSADCSGCGPRSMPAFAGRLVFLNPGGDLWRHSYPWSSLLPINTLVPWVTIIIGCACRYDTPHPSFFYWRHWHPRTGELSAPALQMTYGIGLKAVFLRRISKSGRNYSLGTFWAESDQFLNFTRVITSI